MKNFLGKRLTGATITIHKHHDRAMVIADAIFQRFGVHIYQYQQKHLVWFLTQHNQTFSKGTRYNYFLTIKRIINLSPQFKRWENVLIQQFNQLEAKYVDV